MSREPEPTIEDFIKHLASSEVILAAVTSEVHRFFYDKCFSVYTERPFKNECVEFVNEIHNILWNQAPGWRDTLQRAIKRYQVKDAQVNWIPL